MLQALAFLGVLCVSFVACAVLCVLGLAVGCVLAVIGGVMVEEAIAWLKARHVWHSWGKWQLRTYEAVEVVTIAGQYRVCEVCGRRKSRDV